MKLIDRILGKTIVWDEPIRGTVFNIIKIPFDSHRYKFTVKTDLRKLSFQFVTGDPVTICIIIDSTDDEYSYSGQSVLKKGDKWDCVIALRGAFTSAINRFGLQYDEKEMIVEKFVKVLKQANEDYDMPF